jgi:hypothetical protein
MDKRNWFFKQRVQFAEMREADNLVEQTFRDLRGDMFAEQNFLKDLVSVVETGPASTSVEVGPATGWDNLGQRVVQPNNPETFSFAGDSGTNIITATLYLKYQRNPTNPRTDGLGGTIQYDQDDGFVLERDLGPDDGSQNPPAPRVDESIPLANITIPTGGGNIVNSGIDTTIQNLRSSFPAGRLKDFAAGLFSPGYAGEIKLLNDRVSPATKFQVEFARVVDRTGAQALSVDASQGLISVADGTVVLSPGVSGRYPGDPGIGTAPAAGEWHVFLVGDSQGINQDAVMLKHLDGGPGAPGGTDLTAGLAGTGYDLYRRVGSIIADANGDLLSVRKINGVTMYEERRQFYSAAIGVGSIGRTPVVVDGLVAGPTQNIVLVPTTAERGIFALFGNSNGFNFGAAITLFDGASSPLSGAGKLQLTSGAGGLGAAPNDSIGQGSVHLDALQQVEVAVSNPGGGSFFCSAHVLGYVDDLKFI